MKGMQEKIYQGCEIRPSGSQADITRHASWCMLDSDPRDGLF